MGQGQWSKRKDLVGHSSGHGGQRKRATGRGGGVQRKLGGNGEVRRELLLLVTTREGRKGEQRPAAVLSLTLELRKTGGDGTREKDGIAMVRARLGRKMMAMGRGQWLERKDLVGHSGADGDQRKRASGRGSGVLREKHMHARVVL